MSTCYYLTKEGLEKLDKEIEQLEYGELPVVVREVSTARGNGDLSENAEYHAAKDKQRNIMKKLGYLKDFKAKGSVVDCENISCDCVRFGLFVEIVDLDTDKKKKIRLVGDYEADISKNLISVSAPLGKALLGKKLNDEIEFENGDKFFVYKILNISKE